jgi:hypothetical protein
MRLAALTRALLVDDMDVVRRVDADVRKARPELAADLDAVAAAPTREERRFLVTLLLARRPGLRPFMTSGQRRITADWGVTPPRITPIPLEEADGLRDNWWCALSPSPVGSTTAIYQAYQPGSTPRSGPRLDPMTAALYADPSVVPTASFLTAEEQARAAREWKTLDRDRERAGLLRARGAGVGRDASHGRAGGGRRCTASCDRHGSAAAPSAAATSRARRSRCSTSASRAASGRRRRRTGSAEPPVRRQTAGSFCRVLTMPPIRPMPMMTSAPARIHTDETPMRDAA